MRQMSSRAECSETALYGDDDFIRDGKRQVQDGPYADTKELLGGYLIIDVPTLDDALLWAERSPSSLSGSTEVRPVLPRGGG